MESPRFENQSDAEDYIRELESKKEINLEGLESVVNKTICRTCPECNVCSTDLLPKEIAQEILSKYKMFEK